ncbi:unnamed protein product (macronuclear) [Paramecium tetraurelia]|uniref:B box-type domain-containing protein n=1 Tax=Paramecium tetraurelia TaxID=5888 RepID=A0BWN7_PARTE|nr:uncharacterized protein GSPATT00032806001 [Paramecium tetraurelia]CAK62954.1 unnamed protein product [Paramecium tetraurelia]|eukprot:XP_001430352.1 hypothetical protein (macronuclear) [Paramecium tetraurelia strain d4-2]
MDQINCQNPNHDSQRIKYICVDPNCQAQQKIGCADCFLEDHVTHQRKTVDQFHDQVKQQLDTFNQIEFQPITNAIQQDLEKQIDKELENCLSCITYRFTSIQSDLKSSLDGENEKLQESYNALQLSKNQEVDSIKNVNDLHSISQEEVNDLVKFYQESSKIQQNYSKASEIFSDEKQKVKQKKQKYLQKLHTIMQGLMREFNELMTTKNFQQEDFSEFETPQKSTMSPNKIISLVESTRQSRRFYMNQTKKLLFGNASRKNE